MSTRSAAPACPWGEARATASFIRLFGRPWLADLWNGKATADFPRQAVRDLSVTRHGLDLPRAGITPERVTRAFALEVTPMLTKVAQEVATLHWTVTVS